MRNSIFAAALFSVAVSAFAGPKQLDVVPGARAFEPGAKYQVCFVPDGANCERLIVQAIEASTSTIHVLAYSFTSPSIAEALVKAHQRKVRVQVVLDKSQEKERYTGATFLENAGIPVVIDAAPGIAISHNKVMIFDGNGVFTGSFNFTRSAQSRNAENGLLISGDASLSRAYLANWAARFKVSRPYRGLLTGAGSRMSAD